VDRTLFFNYSTLSITSTRACVALDKVYPLHDDPLFFWINGKNLADLPFFLSRNNHYLVIFLYVTVRMLHLFVLTEINS